MAEPAVKLRSGLVENLEAAPPRMEAHWEGEVIGWHNYARGREYAVDFCRSLVIGRTLQEMFST